MHPLITRHAISCGVSIPRLFVPERITHVREIKKAAAILGEDENVCFEIRCIREYT